MSSAAPAIEAVLFDLDGVLTDTASLHESAWQIVFDDLFGTYPGACSLTHSDYLSCVEDLRRPGGLERVLARRGIDLPAGSPGDPPDAYTLGALARRKEDYFLRVLRQRGTHAFASSATLLRALRRQGVATAVVTSSTHCAEVLEMAGLSQLLDLQVHGLDAVRLNLPRKPDPAMLIEASRRLDVPPSRTAIIVDSASGVEAGMRGGFVVVVRVVRRGTGDHLPDDDGCIVVEDLSELLLEPAGPGRARLTRSGVSVVTEAPSGARADNDWRWSYDGVDPPHEGAREALCTLGNGYFATRGAAAEATQDDVHYPGTYVAGCYNRLLTSGEVGHMENESLVNLPNWLVMRCRIGDSGWLQPETADVSAYLQEVDMLRGVFCRQMRLTDNERRRTLVSERRIVSMAQPHLAAQKFEITATNWCGELHILAGLDARVANLNVRADREFDSQHLRHPLGRARDAEAVTMEVETSQSRIRVHEAARIRVSVEGRPCDVERRVIDQAGFIGQEVCVHLRQGDTVTVEKIVALYTSRDPAISEPGLAALESIQLAGSFDELLRTHIAAWKRIWSRCRFEIGDAYANRVLRLHGFHMLQTLSRQVIGLDVGVPARGLHGEGYRGHVFWDDVLVLPLATYRLPELTRQLLGYRVRRLSAARRLAAESGYRGALFPWQSGSDGREETPEWIFNPRSRRWFADRSRLQRHVGLAIAYEVWQYFEITNDLEFMVDYGAELLIEIARFFSSLAIFNAERGRYEIRGVVGPDEFHDAYPNADRPGIDNNAYTNVMVVWLMRRAIDTVALLRGYYSLGLISTLGVEAAEIERWTDITSKMFVPFHDGVISQFEGYERLAEFDWDAYRNRYGDIGRLDLILEAEGDSPNRYRLSKQADTLMLFYLLSADELRELLAGLGYPLTPETILNTIDYYLARTSHGSTLSRIVDAWVLARSDRQRSWSAFTEALTADVSDRASSSTAEGIHLGAMAATLDIVQRCYTGLEAREGVLWLNPRLPNELASIELNLLYRQQWLTLRITDDEVRITADSCPVGPIRIGVGGRLVRVCPGETHVVRIPRRTQLRYTPHPHAHRVPSGVNGRSARSQSRMTIVLNH
jgi:trehalose/maltose hydrolase-like predicted phosphorylase/beta-phosphoglucomutase-like phosphatase (HAD superfamily)